MAQGVTFENDTIGSSPKGWVLTMTGKGTPKWTVEWDDTGQSTGLVLKQSGKATYPLALREGTSIKDGWVEAVFKPISGSEDRAGGLVWFDFAALCGGPRSYADYVDLARRFHTVLLTGVPRMSPKRSFTS